MNRIFAVCIFLLSLQFLFGAEYKGMNMHCAEDTIKINSILNELESFSGDTGERIVEIAMRFIDSPEDNYYMKDSIAGLRINVDSFTPLMFINNLIAFNKTAGAVSTRRNWRTFADEFVEVACRRGENNGFPSIMYHTSDWIGDNISRGNLREITEDYSGVVDRMKSLDEMTRFRQRYAALKDSATFEKVRMTEMGFRTHRVPALKKETIKKKDLVGDLQNGDIIVLVPSRDGMDYFDIGVVVKENGLPYLIHVSPLTHKVVKEKEDLARYITLMTKHIQGYRILRLRD